MPTRARYLSHDDLISIIKLRGIEQPKKIAAKYHIGLTRLYKIWTDASENTKLPGGFAGTAAGKHLTDQINKLNSEISKQGNKYTKLKKQFDDGDIMINKIANDILMKQKTISALACKYKQLCQNNDK